ncbi:MAG: winged helix-turn-helix domain-containing protein [Candidatus Micrarchaeia archaeon]
MKAIEVKAFFFAIGDYNKFSILAQLMKKDMSISEIVKATKIEQSNVSHHMRCLLNCGFVTVRKEDKLPMYGLNRGVRPMMNSIIRHIKKYKGWIMSCDIAKKEYIIKVIK